MEKQRPKSLGVTDTPEQKVSYSDLAEIKVSPEEVVFHFGL